MIHDSNSMIREQEQEWKRNLYKAKNSPLPTSGTAASPPDDPPNTSSNEDEWKRQLHQKKIAAQNALSPEDPPEEEAEAMAPSLLTSPYPSPPEEKKGANPAATAEKNLTQKIREGTAEALRQSWLNLIDSIFLTYLYIIFHYIMAYLGGPFSRFFPRAGREWIMKNLGKTPMPEKTKNWSIETTGAIIEPFELILFFLIAGLFMAQILIFAFIIYVFTHPCESVAAVGGFIGFVGWVAKALGICE